MGYLVLHVAPTDWALIELLDKFPDALVLASPSLVEFRTRGLTPAVHRGDCIATPHLSFSTKELLRRPRLVFFRVPAPSEKRAGSDEW
jgi:hypothetical protein